MAPADRVPASLQGDILCAAAVYLPAAGSLPYNTLRRAVLHGSRIRRPVVAVRPDNEHPSLRGERLTPAKICPVCGKQYASSDRFCPTDGAVLRSPDATG